MGKSTEGDARTETLDRRHAVPCADYEAGLVRNFSLGDAAGTATAAGALWGLKWTVIGWTSQWVKLMRSPRLFVVPVFEDNVKFSTEVDCKGRISAGYAMYAGFRLLVRAMQADEGIKQWKEIVHEMRSRRREKAPHDSGGLHSNASFGEYIRREGNLFPRSRRRITI